jgi:MoxR-like ATPase
MADIEFTKGPYAGNKIELPEGGVIMGRGGDGVNLVLEDAEVSSRHAQLQILEGAWVVADLGSSNGTLVNGQSVQATRLKDGDSVDVGQTQFVFRLTSAPPAAPAGEAAPAPAAPAAVAAPPGASEEDVKLVLQMKERTDRIRREVAKVIVGQKEVLDQVLMCMIAGGHALLVGLPGMAKTLMVSTIARVLDMKFKRIQFTPDLMPSDIVGSDVLETNKATGDKEFRFLQGPIFCNLLLADEINRTPPKTQAALLEAMQEKHVTAGNTTYKLDKPFFVLATQNPIEQEGTYPLPEAQLDRFMFNVWVDYPQEHEEEEIVGATTGGGLGDPQRVLTREEVIQLQEVVRKIPVSEHVVKYVIRLVRATRPVNPEAPQVTKTYVSTGAGPRAGQFLVLAAKARAVLDGRIHVSCNDIRQAAIPVLRHRILTNFAADSEGLASMDIVKKLLEEIKEPGEADYTPQEEAAPKKAPAAKKKK